MDNINKKSLKSIRENVENFIATNIPGSEIRDKRESRWMKILSKLLFFNKRFMTGYVTTVYPHIYVPRLPWKDKNHSPAIATLAHEWVHLYDHQRMGPLFNFLYILPQILAPFALLAFWNLWFLLFLLFFLPLPSPGRAWAEFRGYRMTIAVYYWLSGQKVDLKWVVEQFVGSSYYFMWPFRGMLMRRFQKEFEKIKKNELAPELLVMYNVIKNSKP